MFGRAFHPGDLVIYRKFKHSTRPSPRAKDIDPAPHGEEYNYRIDKYWVVADVLDDRSLVLCTRRGKRHVLPPDDPSLRRASWWERLLYHGRFPKLGDPNSSGPHSSGPDSRNPSGQPDARRNPDRRMSME